MSHPLTSIGSALLVFGLAGQMASAEITFMGLEGGTKKSGAAHLLDNVAEDTLGVSMTNPGSHASLSLRMIANQANADFINTGGETEVQRGTEEFTSLGFNANGSDEIVGQWEEFVGIDTNTIQVIWKTVSGEELLPLGSTVNDIPAFFLEWRFGAEDEIDLKSFVAPETIEIVNATIGTSSDGGDSVNVFNITNMLGSPWDGSDSGSSLPIAGTGVNFVVAQYEFEYAPAPATGLALVGFGAIAARRRR